MRARACFVFCVSHMTLMGGSRRHSLSLTLYQLQRYRSLSSSSSIARVPGGSGLAAGFAASPALPATRHAAIALNALSTPRALEESFVERSRAGAAALFALLLAGAVAALYAAARAHTPAEDMARMTAAASALRVARARARVALLEATTANGVVELGVRVGVGVGVGGARAGAGIGAGAAAAASDDKNTNPKVVRWWASGPPNATIVIALAADDGETAAQWGAVHARLAASRPDVRIVSYDRCGKSASTASSAGAQRAGVAGPLSLRLRDAAAAVAASGSGGGSARHVFSPPPPPA